jgi:hypothetical protein
MPTHELTPKAFAAALLTIGVSSWHRSANIFLISLWAEADALGYAVAYKAEADVRDVNQSPWERRLRRGIKCWSMSDWESKTTILLIDSAAYEHSNE